MLPRCPSASPAAAAATTRRRRGRRTAGRPPTPAPRPEPTKCPTTATEVARAGRRPRTDLGEEARLKGPRTPGADRGEVADIVKGPAPRPRPATPQVKYVGALYANGKEFDSSWKTAADKTIPFKACYPGVVDGFSFGPSA